MADYIDREELLKYSVAIDENEPRFIPVSIVKKLPVIEAKPIIHGRWIINADGYYPFCSNCRNEPKSMSNYCPNCGAKMDEEVLV